MNSELVDSNVISEARIKSKVNKGVRAFFNKIAATALIYELTVVTPKHQDFVKTGVRVNPFTK